MGTFLFGLVVGGNLVWVFMSLRRDGHWREFKARRRGSNPPPPGRKPVPPAGPPEQSLQAQLIRCWGWQADQVARACSNPRLGEPWPEDCEPGAPAPTPPDGAVLLDCTSRSQARQVGEWLLRSTAIEPPAVPRYGWGARQLPPPPPAPGMRREYLWSPSQMAECGGPCWEAWDPRHCDCGALWRDVPLRTDES